MTNNPTNPLTPDIIWCDVAQHLGSHWSWTRRRTPQTPPDTCRGWLRGPGGASIMVRVDTPRWEIHQALDTLVPETGERLHVRDLYQRADTPTHSITVARNRPPGSVAREIARRLLPSLCESLRRLETCRAKRGALAMRRQEAIAALRPLCPGLHECDAHNGDAPRLLLTEPLSMEVRVDDRDQITITRWSGLDVDMLTRVLRAARETS